MSEKSFDFWQDHSLRYLEMAFRSDRRETLANPDGLGSRTGDCGDTVTFFLTAGEGRIQSICFDANGCLNTNACANAVCDLVEGKTLDEAWSLTPEEVIDDLETLPREHTHCAELAVGALYLALADCRRRSGKAA